MHYQRDGDNEATIFIITISPLHKDVISGAIAIASAFSRCADS